MRFLLITFITAQAYGLGDGVAQLPYLVKILSENIKRYEQLRRVIKQEKDSEELLRAINRGIDNATGLLALERASRGSFEFQKIYGEVAKGGDSALYRLNDQSASEGLKMVDTFKEYAKRQEYNAKKVFEQARSASPKGAQRMTAQMTAQVLHALNQLVRINTQILQLQSAGLAGQTKERKDTDRQFQLIKGEMAKALKSFRVSPRFPTVISIFEGCRALRLEMVEIYWIMLTPVVLITMILEFFKKSLDFGEILKRVVISLILLWSFEYVVEVVATIADGIILKLGGVEKISFLVNHLEESFSGDFPSIVKVRQMILFLVSLLCYLIAITSFYLLEIACNLVYGFCM